MKEVVLGLYFDCYVVLIRVCVKDGNVVEVESVFNEFIVVGYKFDWWVYIVFIQIYGVVGVFEKV